MSQVIFTARVLVAFLQRLSLILFAVLALGLVVATGMALTGQWPWIQLDVAWNGTVIESAGIYAQTGLTVFAVTLCCFLPSNARILQLENSHRRFEMSVDDVTRAYHAAHAADRDSAFRIGDAFESMRERLAFLRDHPDLGMLEPELLELAAKMSHISRDLAEAYSTPRVERARSFLEQRQFEVDQFNERLAQARAIHGEFATWINRLELEENVARAKLGELLDEIERLLPEINGETPQRDKGANVTRLPRLAE
ncbi:MAG: DNA repair protein [Pseudomonadota bacterium]